jgi:hypothetical protein
MVPCGGIPMLKVRVAFLFFFSFPLRVMYFVHLCPKEEKKKTREKYLHHKATGPTKALSTVF